MFDDFDLAAECFIHKGITDLIIFMVGLVVYGGEWRASCALVFLEETDSISAQVFPFQKSQGLWGHEHLSGICWLQEERENELKSLGMDALGTFVDGDGRAPPDRIK